MSDITSTIARVRELDAAATPGPWGVNPEWEIYEDLAPEPPCIYHEDSGDVIAYLYGDLFPVQMTIANGETLAEFRTLAVTLADECERLQRVNAQLTNAGDNMAYCLESNDPSEKGLIPEQCVHHWYDLQRIVDTNKGNE